MSPRSVEYEKTMKRGKGNEEMGMVCVFADIDRGVWEGSQ